MCPVVTKIVLFKIFRLVTVQSELAESQWSVRYNCMRSTWL